MNQMEFKEGRRASMIALSFATPALQVCKSRVCMAWASAAVPEMAACLQELCNPELWELCM